MVTVPHKMVGLERMSDYRGSPYTVYSMYSVFRRTFTFYLLYLFLHNEWHYTGVLLGLAGPKTEGCVDGWYLRRRRCSPRDGLTEGWTARCYFDRF